MDPITRDFYEERRRRWRRSAFWRGVFLTVLTAVAIGAAVGYWGREVPVGPHIARVEITDVIYSDPAREGLLESIAEDEDARALIVRIDSPGGTVVAAEALYLLIGEIRETRPVVAVLDGVAASGGYLAAMAADHVVARGNTLTGSIGVIMEYPNVTGLMDRVGVEWETIRSSELKAGPSPFRDLTPEARAVEQEAVDETYAWFRGLVAEERGLEGAALDDVTDGRTMTGRMALEAGLVDAIGGEADAIEWLESVDPGLAELEVATWELPGEDPGFLDYFLKVTGMRAHLALPGLPQGPRLMSILK